MWLLKLLLAVILLNSFVFAEITIDARSSGNTLIVSLENKTEIAWVIGGWRFNCRRDLEWSKPAFNFVTINTPTGSAYTHTAQIMQGDVSGEANLKKGEIYQRDYGWISPLFSGPDSGLIVGNVTNEYLLLKQGGAFLPDKPVEASPIIYSDLPGIIADNHTEHKYRRDYYSTNSFYKDSLGSNGGKYAGGFLDTWFGETQIQFPSSTRRFTVNMTSVSFNPGATGPMYWMALSAMQEIINVDMQWMAGFGVKETFAGIGSSYNGTNLDFAFGCFEVESFTGLDRALGYPNYYVEYTDRLIAAKDATIYITNHGSGSENDFMSDYMGKNSTPINSAYVVNAAFISATNLYGLYGVLSFNTDYFLRDALDGAADPYLGLGVIAPMYNLGMTNHATICAPLNATNWKTTQANPNARNLFPEGNNNYRSSILIACQALIDASKGDNPVTLWDYQMPWSDVERFFLGDGGSVSSQGDGGLLKHFVMDYTTSERQDIMDTLKLGFDFLKGKAPSTTSETVSFRYDWLSLLRLVKRHFSNDAFYQLPQGGGLLMESNRVLPSTDRDTIYPFGNIYSADFTNDFVAIVRATDNENVYSLKWTMDSSWLDWVDGTVVSGGTPTSKDFNITIPRQQVKNKFGDVTGKFWYIVSDSMGNAFVKSAPIKGSPLKSAAAVDSCGDGFADKIHVHITDGALDPSSGDKIWSPKIFNYSWPTQTSLQAVTGSNYSNETFTFTPSDPSGAGLGLVKMKYPSMDNIAEKEIVDSVGPAILAGSAYCNISEITGLQDTLYLTFTEGIENLSLTGGTYFYFKTSTGVEKEVANIIAIDSGNNEWAIIFDPNSIGSYDSVRIVFSSELTDAVSNKAASYNHWVEIRRLGDDDPTDFHAWTVDTNCYGDGLGDQILVQFTVGTGSGAIVASDLDLKSTTINGVTISGTVICDSIVVLLVTGLDGAATGSGVLTLKSGGCDYPFTIVDSVGPALVSASLHENLAGSVQDTLDLVFTESITDNLENGKQYITVNGTAIAVDTAIMVSSTEYTFMLPSGNVVEGDSIALISNSGLIDQAWPNDDLHNPPKNPNRPVEVVVLSKLFIISLGSFYDTNADGKMDRVILSFNKAVTTQTFATMDISIVWKDANDAIITIPILNSNVVFDGSQLIWTVPIGTSIKADQTSFPSDSSWAFVIFTQTKPDNISESLTDTITTVEDMMAPVLASVSYYFYNSAIVNDTVIVSYSESVDSITAISPFKWLEFSSSTLKDVTLANISSTSNNFFVVDLNGYMPSTADSVQINWTAFVQDLHNNVQDTAINKFVPLNFYYTFTVVSASYFDLNDENNASSMRDGRIDEVHFYMDTIPDKAIFSSLLNEVDDQSLILPEWRKLIWVDDHPKVSSDFVGFILRVRQDVLYNDVVTSIEDNDSIVLVNAKAIDDISLGRFVLTSDNISDSLAPVLVYGSYRPLEITDGNKNDKAIFDTLLVHYSEDIIAMSSIGQSDKCFGYKHEDQSLYNMTLILQTPPNTSTLKLFDVVENTDSPVTGRSDSMWIFNDVQRIMTISDKLGNIQINETQPIPLIVGMYKYNFSYDVIPNPFSLKYMEDGVLLENDPANLLGLYKDLGFGSDIPVGVMILGKSLAPIVGEALEDIELDIMIIDPVGNVIASDLERIPVEGSSIYFPYIWDLRNINGRIVGPGTYLAVIKQNGIADAMQVKILITK